MAKNKAPLTVVAVLWADRDKRMINNRMGCGFCGDDVSIPSATLIAAEGRPLDALCLPCGDASYPGKVSLVEINDRNQIPDWQRAKLPDVGRYERAV